MAAKMRHQSVQFNSGMLQKLKSGINNKSGSVGSTDADHETKVDSDVHALIKNEYHQV